MNAVLDDAGIAQFRAREALRALDRGWIPTPLDGKVPITKRWNLLSVPTERDIEDWVRDGRNIGVRTGSISGIVVIDEDSAKGGSFFAAAEMAGETVPQTVTSLTGGGGRHFYFRAPRNLKIPNSAGKLAPHVDVRGEGGQVVYPGSVHPETGQVYGWAPTLGPDDIELAELPQWVINKLTKKRTYADAALENEINRVKAAPEGERNNALNRAAFSLGQLVGGGALDEAKVVAALLAASPLPEPEARATITSGLRAGKEQPRARKSDASPARSVLVPGSHVTDQGEYLEVGNNAFSETVLSRLPPGAVYRRVGVPGEIVEFGGRTTFHPAPIDRLRLLIDREMRLVSWKTPKKDEDAQLIYRPASRDHGGLVLARAVDDPSVRELVRIVRTVIVTPSGRIVLTDGYDEETCAFVSLGGFSVPPVPEHPTPTEVERAVEMLRGELLGDFPFVSESDQANAIALFLLPFARELVGPHPTPLHLVEKPSPGSGGGLMVEALGVVALGDPVPVVTQAGTEDEWRKRITSTLIEDPDVFWLDNVLRLDSSALAAALTARIWGDRELGVSRNARSPVRCVWVACGNNPTVSAEVSRRTVSIRIDPAVARPWERRREGFRHPKLLAWVREHRSDLVHAALTLIRAWIAAGRPEGTQSIGSYEKWAEVIGGILDVAGIRGFLGNRERFYGRADRETASWQSFVAAWLERFNRDRVGVKELARLIEDGTSEPPCDLGRGTDRSQRTRLGEAVAQVVDRRFIVDGRSVRVESAGSHQRAAQYRLVVGESEPREPSEPASQPTWTREATISPCASALGGNVHEVHPGSLPGAWEEAS